MSLSFRVLRLFGTDIKLHWSMPLGVVAFVWAWQPESTSQLVLALLLVVLIFASVTLHELGHTVTAQFFGVSTRAIVLWPLGGFAVLEKRPLTAWQDILITLAGPLANLGLAAVAWLLLALWTVLPPIWSGGYNSALGYVQFAGDALVYLNVALAVFNLLPAYPLDGGQILFRVLDRFIGEPWARRTMLGLSLVLVVMMLVLSVARRDVLLAVTALFIGMGAVTLSAAVNRRVTATLGDQ